MVKKLQKLKKIYLPVPQFGIPSLPKAAPVPISTPQAPIPNVADGLEYTQKIEDLVSLVRVALTDMGEIAVADNPEAGSKIVAKLQAQIARAAQVLADFTTKSARVRRDVKSNGESSYNQVGEILVESNDKTQPEKSELSPEAQEKMDDRHDKAVNDCKADVCKSHTAKRNKIKEAKAAKAAKG